MTPTQTKWTAGEWVVKEVNYLLTGPNATNTWEISAPDNEDQKYWVAHALREDDARLLAASKRLYEALQGVLRVADRKTVEFDAARAALLAADGGKGEA